MSVKFELQKVENSRTGALEDALVKLTTDGLGNTEAEQWCTVNELDRLFEACSRRWAENGWDLEKLLQCVSECEFD